MFRNVANTSRFVTGGGPSVDKLMPGDQILSINGEDVARSTTSYIESSVGLQGVFGKVISFLLGVNSLSSERMWPGLIIPTYSYLLVIMRM